MWLMEASEQQKNHFIFGELQQGNTNDHHNYDEPLDQSINIHWKYIRLGMQAVVLQHGYY